MALWFAMVDTMVMNEGVTLHADGCIKKTWLALKVMLKQENTGTHGMACAR